MNTNTTASIRRLVGLALLSAIIVVLQSIAGLINIGPVSPTFTLIPIVVGAAMYGVASGALLGFVFGVVTLVMSITGADAGGNMMWIANPWMTALLCLVKGTAAGFVSGLVYRALRGRSLGAAVFLAALLCPITNTGIFICGALAFFPDVLKVWADGARMIYYIVFGLVGINFVVELALNIILAPVVLRIIRAARRPD